MRHIIRLAAADHTAALVGPAENRTLLLDASCHTASLARTTGSAAVLTLDGTAIALHIAGTDERLFVHIDGEVYDVAILEPLTVHARAAGAAGGLEARAPMPGNVVALPVNVGDIVRANDVLVIIESMKLEVAIRAPQPGRVAEIRCAIGRGFDKDAVLVLLAPAEET
jgi:biotin carboxyl carrier protein